MLWPFDFLRVHLVCLLVISHFLFSNFENRNKMDIYRTDDKLYFSYYDSLYGYDYGPSIISRRDMEMIKRADWINMFGILCWNSFLALVIGIPLLTHKSEKLLALKCVSIYMLFAGIFNSLINTIKYLLSEGRMLIKMDFTRSFIDGASVMAFIFFLGTLLIFCKKKFFTKKSEILKSCKYCDAKNNEEFRFCIKCGKEFEL